LPFKVIVRALVEHLKGKIHLAKGERAGAVRSLERAIEEDPNLLAPYLTLAGIYAADKEYDRAVALYQAILTRQPGFLQGYVDLGLIYEETSRPDEAEAQYRKALTLEADFAPAAHHLARNLAERGVNTEEVLELARLAKDKMPDDPQVMDTLGWVHFLKRNYEYAIAELKDSLSRIPKDPVVNYHLGKAYYGGGQYENAREFMGKALELDPNFRYAQDARRFVPSQ